MPSVTLTGLQLSVLSGAFFLSGLITCINTPLVDKVGLYKAWEQGSTAYLTSQKARMMTAAQQAAFDSCTLLKPEGREGEVLKSRQAFLFCLSQEYRRFAEQFQIQSAAYQYASCREGQHTESVCVGIAQPVPEKSSRIPPLPLPFD